MANTQTWKNFIKTAYTALTEHLAAHGEVDSMRFEEFYQQLRDGAEVEEIYALANQTTKQNHTTKPNKNNGEKATEEWKALMVIVGGGMLLIYRF